MREKKRGREEGRKRRREEGNCRKRGRDEKVEIERGDEGEKRRREGKGVRSS